jgi:hypothetical protein
VSYLITGSRLHYWLWSHRFFGQSESTNFPGVTALVLVALALAWPETRRDVRVRMCLVTAAGCVLVSMLPNTPVYPALYEMIPLFRAVRVQAHIGQIVLLLIAVVAGFGVAGLARRWPHARTWPIAVLVLVFAANLEALRAPFVYTPFSEIPPIYDVLAEERDAVVVELPFWPPRIFFANGTYMLNATRHFRPMLNGYSGFRPSSYSDTYDAVLAFPDVASLAALHSRGVTHVVIHTEQFCQFFGRERCDAIKNTASLRPMAEAGDIHIYRLR